MTILESGEDYLERILVLSKTLTKVREIDIVNDMGYSKPSVSLAMKKLKENGYIEINDGSLLLTKAGEEIANKIYERHLVLTNYLISLGVDEITAKKDACKIEHDISETTFDCIKKQLK